jgi:uncharacterized protein
MPTLTDIAIKSYLQTLPAVEAFLAKGAAHCAEHGIDPQTIVETRIFDDMLPFRFQIHSVVHHSQNAVAGVMAGEFGPPSTFNNEDGYQALQKLVGDAIATLKAADTAAFDARIGADMVFKLGKMAIPFTAESFLLSFSLPNFHFHATTAYAILRSKGVKLGKRDFLGHMQMKA